MTRTIHAIAIESNSSGAIDWYDTEAEARTVFDAAVANVVWADNDINRFAFDVPDDTHDDEVTLEADTRMWELDYTAIERRAATEGDDIFLPR